MRAGDEGRAEQAVLGRMVRLRCARGRKRKGVEWAAERDNAQEEEEARPASRPKPGREGREGRAGSWGWAENEERQFFKMNFFSNSSFQIQAQFKSNSSIVSNILPYLNKNGQFC